MKCCTVCKEHKALEDFPRDRAQASGRKSRCKVCYRAWCATWHAANRPLSRSINRDWHARNRERSRELARKWKERTGYRYREQDPLKQAARDAVRQAVKDGTLVRPLTCERCFVTGPTQAHHADYTQPLAVEWLCAMCHGVEGRKAA